MELITVSTDKLLFKKNIRDASERKLFSELLESIRVHGILTPLQGVKLPSGEIEVVDGSGRGQAAIELGITEVPVIIDRGLAVNEADSIKRQLVCNSVRENLNAGDFTRGFTQLMEETGSLQSTLAKQLGLGSSVSKKLALNKLPEEIRKKIDQGVIPASCGYELTKVKDKAVQLELASQLEARDLTRDALIQVIRSLNTPTKKAEKPKRKAVLPVNENTVVSVTGVDLTLVTLIGALEDLVKFAKAEHRRGLTLETFIRLANDNVQTKAPKAVKE